MAFPQTPCPVSDPRLVVHAFRRGPLCALVAPGHAIADEEKVGLAELARHKLIFLPDVSGTQRFVNEVFRTEG